MSFCVGVAIAMHLAFVNMKPYLYFLGPQIEVSKECDITNDVLKTSRTIKPNNLSWERPPDILICSQSNVKTERVRKATRYWTNLGYDFGTINRALPGNFRCINGDPYLNEIIIDIPSQSFSFGEHLGTTRTWWRTDTGQIIKAKIEIASGWENAERVLEHELGHAIGWKDNNIQGHIMNRSWTNGGSSGRGLRNKN